MAIILFLLGCGVAGYCAYLYCRPSPTQMYTQPILPSTRALLTDSRHNFATGLADAISRLPLTVADKHTLHQFTLASDGRLGQLLASEKISVTRTGIWFGALTVSIRLRLAEFSNRNLTQLLKLESLIAQSLGVESARLVQGAGFIDCEIPSPVRARIDEKTLLRATYGTTVAIGLDTTLQPATIDIAQHGLIAAIAPSRRGKTTAIKSVLYLLKTVNPDLELIVVAFKTSDWQPFRHCANVIIDSGELNGFCQWLTGELYARAKQPSAQRIVVVFDDLVNLLSQNAAIGETIRQCAALGAGTGITTVVSTQFTGKSSGGVDVFANATCRLLFKPSSNLQGARDGGMAGLGLDQLSTQRGDALLVVDGDPVRITTALIADDLIARLPDGAIDPAWLVPSADQMQKLSLSPMEQLIEQLDGWLLDDGVFDWENGKFANRTEALRQLGWSNNGRNVRRLSELEHYIFEQSHHDD